MMYNTKEMYQRSFYEVIAILMGFPMEDLEKIPMEEIEFFFDNMDTSYGFYIDYDKTLQEQEISSLTKAILANLYRDYLASYEEKQKIIEKDKADLQLLEIEKRKKYNPEEIFKQVHQKTNIGANIASEQNSIIEYKESIFNKIVNKIKSFFTFT